MAAPSVDEFYRPVLEIAGESNGTVSRKTILAELTPKLKLTQADLQEMIPSGRITTVQSRTSWSLTILKQAGMLDNPARGQYRLTPRGRDFLANRPPQSPIRYDDLKGLISLGERTDAPEPAGSPSDNVSPVERMDEVHQQLQATLSREILDNLIGLEPDAFERLVVNLLEKMGYGDGQPVGRSGDGGIDGVINEDTLGLEKIYIQAKKWGDAQVGSPMVNQFAGALLAHGAAKGVLITTSTFSGAAEQAAQKVAQGIQSLRLIDGRELAELMIRHGVGVVTEITYEVKKLDANYFAEV